MSRPSPSSRLAAALPLLVVAILGAVHLPHPLHGDAALYQYGARTMAGGGSLYRDFWDLKQPGIYVFHWLAGRLIGFSEVGLHALELALLLALSLAQVLVLRRAYDPPWLARVVPLASIGAYYAVTTDWHLTQPAVLLSAPLFVVAVVAGMPWRRARAAWLLAGAAAATAVAFKIAVAPLLPVRLGAGLLYERARGTPTGVLLRRNVLPCAAGAALVGGAGVLWLQLHGGWDWFVWTHDSWRREALEVRGPHPVSRVVESTTWFAKRFAPWLLLAAAAPIGWRGLRAERLFVVCALWLVVGIARIVTEPFAGWEFDYLELIAPVGILALRGVQGGMAWAGSILSPRTGAFLLGAARRDAAACAVVVAANLPGLARWVPKARELAAHAPRLSAGEFDYQRAIDDRYEAAWRTTAFLREKDAAPGAIYVFGDPLMLLMAGRSQASPVHGWAWEIQPPPVWRRVAGDLRRVQPPYIFVAAAEDSLIADRGEGVRGLLSETYAVRARDGSGTWYQAAPSK